MVNPSTHTLTHLVMIVSFVSRFRMGFLAVRWADVTDVLNQWYQQEELSGTQNNHNQDGENSAQGS